MASQPISSASIQAPRMRSKSACCGWTWTPILIWVTRSTLAFAPVPDPTPRDSVDALLESWGARREDLDFSPVAVLTRLARVRRHLDVELEGVYAEHGLEPASFALLATIDRLDPGGAGVPRARLTEELGLTAPGLEQRLAT